MGSASPFAVRRLNRTAFVVLLAGCRVEDSGERRKDCVGVRAGFGWRKFLAVVRIYRGTCGRVRG
jgi:hypothetical protein